MEQDYFFQRQKTDYWRQMEFRGLRQQKNGEALSRIYNDMELQAVVAHGYIYHNTPFPLQKQIALAVEADEELVAEALEYFKACGWIVEVDDNALYFPRVVDNIGSRTRDADRKARKRREAEEEKSGNFPQKDGNFPHSIVDINKEKNNNIFNSRVEGEPSPSDETITAEFNSLWGLYPESKRNESSKRFALAAYKAARQDGASEELIRQALERYIKDTPPRYVKKASKWFEDNAWKDTGTPSNTPPPSSAQVPPHSSESLLERARQYGKECNRGADSSATEKGKREKPFTVPTLGEIDAFVKRENLHVNSYDLYKQLSENGLKCGGKVYTDWRELARAIDKEHGSSMK